MLYRIVYKLTFVLIFASIPLLCQLILCPIALSSDYQELQKRYVEIKDSLSEHRSGLPIYIESYDKNRILSGHVYSIISHPFSRVKNTLIHPANWCDISLLHLNIKACTYKNNRDINKLTIYTGRKFYQPPEDAFVLDYMFRIVANKHDYFKILLTADTGPLDTSDYRIVLEAMPVKGKKTFIRFSYTYAYGLITQAAMEGYFATLGSEKVGFSIIYQNKNGKPVYIDGTRGAIERNSVRYYFAFQAYLDTLRIPENRRFVKRIHLWYSLTERFKDQLFELPREEYIHSKKLERQNQLNLQEQIDQVIK